MNEWLCLGNAEPGDRQRAGSLVEGGLPALVEVSTVARALAAASGIRPSVIVLRVSLSELVRTGALRSLHDAAPAARIMVFPRGRKPPAGSPTGWGPDAHAAVGSLVLQDHARSAGEARGVVGRVCTEADEAGLDDDAKLVATELVSNAVKHARTALGLTVRAVLGAVRIEVADRIRELPFPRLAEQDDSGGRGLLLVDALSSAWGVDPTPSGKTVWAQLERV
jgi:signal transduction histidine kinase